MTSFMQEIRDGMQLLISGRCNMGYRFAMLIYLQSHQLFDPLLHNVKCRMCCEKYRSKEYCLLISVRGRGKSTTRRLASDRGRWL